MPVSYQEAEGVFKPSELNKEETVVEFSSSKPFFVQGYISLKELAGGDSVTIREYIDIDNDGVYERYITRTYSDAQPDDLVRFHQKLAKYKYKVTIEQTAGTIRNFPYYFIMFVIE